MRKPSFRPSVLILESRWLPTAAIYPDPFRTGLQALFVAEANSAANPVVFLGDSITAYWGNAENPAPGSAIFTTTFGPLNAANFGIAGDTTANLLGRVEGGDLNGKPKVAVVLIGVNDLLGGAPPSQVASGVTSVVEAIHSESPDTKILLLGVLPTDFHSVNLEVAELDSMISDLGQALGITYLNPGVQLERADGLAKPSLLLDGLHPSAAGYQILAGPIDAAILGLLQENGTTTPSPDPASVQTATSGSTTPPPQTPPSQTPPPQTPPPQTPSPTIEPSMAATEFIPLVGELDLPTTPVIPTPSIALTAKPKPSQTTATELVDALPV